jgi:Xaa-Pro aminopeptidase
LGFETLTLAPIDLALVEPLLLDAHETRWLDTYHARCRKELGPLLDAATRSWLERVTQPLVRG